MKKFSIILILIGALAFTGCSGKFWAGMGGGALGAGAAYEYNAKKQIDKIDKELADGTIDQAEYDIRKDQINRGSLLQK